MLRVWSCSRAGGHPVNEDVFEVSSPDDDVTARLCLLADGQGGQPGGREAAQLACREGIRGARMRPASRLVVPETWCAIVEQADRAVCDDPEAGFCTLIGLSVTATGVVGASSGDSAAFCRSNHDVRELTSEQRKNPPIGSGRAVATPFEQRLRAPWSLLVMSDGVWKYGGWETVVKIARERDGADVIEGLLQAASLPNGALQDDFTLVVIASD